MERFMRSGFLDEKDFIQMNWSADKVHLISRTALHPQKEEHHYRVYYYLPNGKYTYYYTVPPLINKNQKDRYLKEFGDFLRRGLIPKEAAKKLLSTFDDKNGDFEVYFDKYFSTYAVGPRAKSKVSIEQIEGMIKPILNYFKTLKSYDSILQISDRDLKDWDEYLQTLKDSRIRKKDKEAKLLSPATRNSRRKQFRAFLTVAKERGYPLQCDPTKMNIFEYTKGGEIDESCDARKVIFPEDLLQASIECSFEIDTNNSPDMKMIMRMWERLGIRPGEMGNLCEDNLVYKNGRIAEIKIKDLQHKGENNYFYNPKNQKSYRNIPLPKFAIEFFENLVEKLKGVKRYSRIDGELKEFPFLFVFWDDRSKCFIKDGRKLAALFRQLTNFAIDEKELPYKKDFYIFRDLRRACNLFLKTKLQFNDDSASAFLGHNKYTNLKHYQLDEDKAKIDDAKMRASLQHGLQLNPDIAEEYF